MIHNDDLQNITPLQLKERLASSNPPIVLDVREESELEICALPKFIHIPLSHLPHQFNQLPRDQLIVTVCHHGYRSLQAAFFLKSQNFEHVLNLIGGIHAWAEQVDPQMKKY